VQDTETMGFEPTISSVLRGKGRNLNHLQVGSGTAKRQLTRQRTLARRRRRDTSTPDLSDICDAQQKCIDANECSVPVTFDSMRRLRRRIISIPVLLFHGWRATESGRKRHCGPLTVGASLHREQLKNLVRRFCRLRCDVQCQPKIRTRPSSQGFMGRLKNR
jgi:hypothetical protein